LQLGITIYTKKYSLQEKPQIELVSVQP